MTALKAISAILKKEILIEYRTRYSLYSVILFILTSNTIVLFGIGGESISPELSSGMYWLIVFFCTITALQKTFIYELEKNTFPFLIFNAPSYSIYFGKLLYNYIYSLVVLSVAAIFFFIFVSDLAVKSPDVFIVLIIFSSLAVSSVLTIISAIISKAQSKSALLTILSFPVILPVMVENIYITADCIKGTSFSAASSDILFIIAFSGVIIPVSFVLFDYIISE